MPDTLQKEKKKVFTFHLKNYIEKEEWKKLISLLPGAEEVGVDNKLLLKSYLLLGDNFNSKKPYSDAIVYYLKAVSILADESVYIKLASSLKLFYNLFASSFSKSDLQYLQTSLRPLYNKISQVFPNSFALLNELKSIIYDAKVLEESTAKELIESPASYELSKICNNFYRPKNPQEVFEHFSDVINDSFQDFYDEESKKEPENDKKKKKSKKKKKDKDE